MFLLFCGDSLRDSLHYLDCRDTFYILYFYSYIQFFRGFHLVGRFVKIFCHFQFHEAGNICTRCHAEFSLKCTQFSDNFSPPWRMPVLVNKLKKISKQRAQAVMVTHILLFGWEYRIQKHSVKKQMSSLLGHWAAFQSLLKGLLALVA